MKFQSGESGNPNGRPKGTGHRQQLFNELVTPHTKALLNEAIKLALNGSEVMLRVFLDRILPAKPIDEPITTGTKSLNGTLSEQGRIALTLITSGQLTPSEGTALLQAISSQAKLIETDEILIRLKTLEEACHARNK